MIKLFRVNKTFFGSVVKPRSPRAPFCLSARSGKSTNSQQLVRSLHSSKTRYLVQWVVAGLRDGSWMITLWIPEQKDLDLTSLKCKALVCRVDNM